MKQILALPWTSKLFFTTKPAELSGVILAAVALSCVAVVATPPGQCDAQEIEASYRLEEGWARLPEGVPAWGQTIGLEPDPDGNLWTSDAGDRVNQRIQVFDQDGRYLKEWTGVMAREIYITEDDTLFVADYQLRNGIVIVSATDFSEIGFIEGPLPEGVAADSKGTVYAAKVGGRNLKKFVKN